MTRILELENVQAGYGTFQALFDVSLAVDQGEAVGLLGPNGAGKTTLLRVISGMLPPTKGQIRYFGEDVTKIAPAALVSKGMVHVPEGRRLFPRLTVMDNLRMGAFHPAARPKFDERLETVFEMFPKLKERAHQVAGKMSGGEQQMCAIGRALMSGPRLLLLDEPSAGLAPLVVDQIFRFVRNIRASGITVLIVEQNVNYLLDFVDRAYVIESGHIETHGTAEELRNSDEIAKTYFGSFEGTA